MAIQSAYNLAMRILGFPGRPTTKLTCSGPLETPTHAILSVPSPSGGMNEPSIQ